ncbi:MAG: glyceraldehyde 3-phosphate dehydrogenase NAD-binding domain-containing protein, partial [Acidimicrobiales bacterium]
MTDRAVRVAINGFGRIGRSFLRVALQRQSTVDIVAVNDTNDPAMLGYLLEYDTVHRQLADAPKLIDGHLQVGRFDMKLSAEADPEHLPWAALDIDVVVESTGRFTMAPEAARHVEAGARRVVISAPATGADVTICIGVNHERFDPARHVVVSN